MYQYARNDLFPNDGLLPFDFLGNYSGALDEDLSSQLHRQANRLDPMSCLTGMRSRSCRFALSNLAGMHANSRS